MKIKVGNRIENIFAHAVAMDNRGMGNVIHCIGKNIFIVNTDHSAILRFSLRKNEPTFSTPISFNANDYDSPQFEIIDDKIVFHTGDGEYERRKYCSMQEAGFGAAQIRRIFRKYHEQLSAFPFSFYLSSSCCSLLEEQLSHIEILVEGGRLILRQRNIYSGTILEVTNKTKGLLELDVSTLPETFGPVGLKTKDFTSLFAFHKTITFTPGEDIIYVSDYEKQNFDGILAFCKYDEMIQLYDDKEE